MAGFKRPKNVVFGELPKTSTGKIQKFELRMKAKELQMDPKTYKFDTLSLHAGYQPDKNAGSRQVPIY